MGNIPEIGRVFRFKKDFSQMKIDKNNQINVWMRDERCWCDPFETKQENSMKTQLGKGDWCYLFEYSDKEFSANSMSHAYNSFLDEAWGNHYVEYLSELGVNTTKIHAVEDLNEIENDGYYLLKQKLENGAVLQIEVWANDNGTYKCFAQEISLDLVN